VFAPSAGCGSPGSGSDAPLVVDESVHVALAGHVPPWAASARDVGPLPADRVVDHLTLMLARSPAKEAEWQALLAAQQTPGSPDDHRWLTPEQIAARFGASDAELAAVRAWLGAHGLHVDATSRARTWLSFGGRAGDVASALSTELHEVEVRGERRLTVLAEPSVPAALAPLVRAVVGLSTSDPAPQGRGEPVPDYTTASGKHYVTPADFGTLYDLGPVYAAGLDGKGQTVAIAGRSRVVATDISAYQQKAGLPVVAPTVTVPTTGVDPGTPNDGDTTEATIDVQRVAGVAPGATIDLVVSGTPSGSSMNGLAIAVQYAVDNDVAPVLSISFYQCEAKGGTTWTDFYDGLFQQAAMEGMSVFVCSGDSGAAGCDTDDTTPPASQSLGANYICASGSATCVGGTEFADTASPSTYWSASNGATLGSVKGYIPEGAWNEPTNASGNPNVYATGGGVSTIVAKPTWQKGPGVPADGFRDTPDVSFSSSAHDGYWGCFAQGNGDCAAGSFEYFYGTSAAAPSMAGITALVDERAGKAQGNLNPMLYTLAAGPAAASVFHDVTVATSGVATCSALPSMCNNSTPGPTTQSGGLAGYDVGAGFDLATGWGSIDVANLLLTQGCVGATDGTACDDMNACTSGDACKGGLCTGTAMTCAATDACHAPGTCDPTTGTCSNPAKANGTSCDDGNACTSGDACDDGACAGTPVTCMPMDACHVAGTCGGDAGGDAGACTNPEAPDGTTCPGGACAKGVCVAAKSPDADAGAGGDAGAGAGADASAGASADAGAGAGAGGASSSSGCGCRVVDGSSAPAPLAAFGALAALAFVRAGGRRRLSASRGSRRTRRG
jgi:hypothetical protein